MSVNVTFRIIASLAERVDPGLINVTPHSDVPVPSSRFLIGVRGKGTLDIVEFFVAEGDPKIARRLQRVVPLGVPKKGEVLSYEITLQQVGEFVEAVIKLGKKSETVTTQTFWKQLFAA